MSKVGARAPPPPSAPLTSSALPTARAAEARAAKTATAFAGYHCNGSACIMMDQGFGRACSRGGECASGNCVDNVCCNSACTAMCQSCLASQTGSTDGTCANITAGTDPANECSVAGHVCIAGSCVFLDSDGDGIGDAKISTTTAS